MTPSSPLAAVRDEIRALASYHVADPAGLVKLDAMENPYELPEVLRHELASLMANCPVNRYPTAGADSLRQRLREVMGVPAGCDLILGNGSDELIQMLAMVFNRPGAVMLAPEPTFVMYRMIATFVGMPFVGVPLKADFSLDEEAMLAAIAEHKPALVFLAYPNNPTGNLFDARVVQRIIDAAPGVVVVDEAYFPFSDTSFLHTLDRQPKALVMRTLSKQGLAGLRLGFLVGGNDLVAELDKVRLPYNINTLTQIFAEKILERVDVLIDQAAAIVSDRELLAARLAELPGVEVYPSAANFILCRVADAAACHQGLKQRNILIKNLHGSHPFLENCLRFTVGTAEENEQLFAALAAILGA